MLMHVRNNDLYVSSNCGPHPSSQSFHMENWSSNLKMRRQTVNHIQKSISTDYRLKYKPWSIRAGYGIIYGIAVN